MPASTDQPPDAPRILYCRCAYAQVVPADVKDAVLRRLAASGAAFETVSDLCEMSARRDPRLAAIAGGTGPIRIAACYPRAVRGLFHAAGADLPAGAEIRNMREEDADTIADAMVDAPDEAPAANP